MKRIAVLALVGVFAVFGALNLFQGFQFGPGGGKGDSPSTDASSDSTGEVVRVRIGDRVCMIDGQERTVAETIEMLRQRGVRAVDLERDRRSTIGTQEALVDGLEKAGISAHLVRFDETSSSLRESP